MAYKDYLTGDRNNDWIMIEAAEVEIDWTFTNFLDKIKKNNDFCPCLTEFFNKIEEVSEEERKKINSIGKQLRNVDKNYDPKEIE